VLRGRRDDWEDDYVDLLTDNALVGFMAAPGDLQRLISAK
jgi:hypothetical protein